MPGVGRLYIGEKRGYTLLVSALTFLWVSCLIWLPAELFYLSVAIFLPSTLVLPSSGDMD